MSQSVFILHYREAVISEMQSTLERAVSDKEDLEKRLHNSSQSGSLDGSISNNKKVYC